MMLFNRSGAKKKRFIATVLTVAICISISLGAVCTAAYTPDAADKLYSLKLLNGVGLKPDGSPDFSLDRPATRAEVAVILIRLIGKEAEALDSRWAIPFTDVPDWARSYVGCAYAYDLTQGVDRYIYGSNRNVTASEFITLILRTLGYTSGTDFEWDKAWELSDSLGITEGKYDSTSEFLRRDIIAVSYNALSIPIKGSDKTLCSSLIAAGVFTEAEALSAGLDTGTITIAQAQTPLAAAPRPAASSLEGRVFDLVNAERVKYGLNPLVWDEELASVALSHSVDMYRKGFFHHINLEGKTPADRMRAAGMDFDYSGENLARGFKTPEAVVAAWMESPGHKKVILSDKSTSLGIGIYERHWTADFSG